MAESRPNEQREFARVDCRIPARYGIVDPAHEDRTRAEILERASVWSPANEGTLRELASSGHGHEAQLAAALLDACAQIVTLRARIGQGGGPMQAAEIRQISGGGGKMSTSLLLEAGAVLDLRLDPADDAPPIRTLVEIVHVDGSAEAPYGFRFAEIHAGDRERLIRFVYLLQRRALRRAAHEEESSET